MKLVLVIFTATFIGFWTIGILYAINSSNLFKHRNINRIEYHPYTVTSNFNLPRNNCYDIAIKCPEGEDCDCVGKCGIGFGETFVLINSNTIYNNQLLDPGKYCLPRETIPCDGKLGDLNYSDGKFICQCKYPDIYGGPFCDELQACFRGFLRNSITQEILDKYNINESDYHCSCDIPDKNGNKMINYPGNKLECFTDPCLHLISGTVASGIGFDEQTGNCSCGDFSRTRVKNMFHQDLKSPCTSCYIREMPESKQTRLFFKCASKYGDLTEASPCKDFDSKTDCEPVVVNLKFAKLEVYPDPFLKFTTMPFSRAALF